MNLFLCSIPIIPLFGIGLSTLIIHRGRPLDIWLQTADTQVSFLGKTVRDDEKEIVSTMGFEVKSGWKLFYKSNKCDRVVKAYRGD